jgi:hypothetical protein
MRRTVKAACSWLGLGASCESGKEVSSPGRVTVESNKPSYEAMASSWVSCETIAGETAETKAGKKATTPLDCEEREVSII